LARLGETWGDSEDLGDSGDSERLKGDSIMELGGTPVTREPMGTMGPIRTHVHVTYGALGAMETMGT